MSGIVGVIASDYQRGRPGAQFWPGAVDTVINVKVILIGLTSEVKRPPLA